MTLLLYGVLIPLMNSFNSHTLAFGEMLKAARLSKNLTRKDAASALNISDKSIAKYESFGIDKEGQAPSLLRLAEMIEFYEIDPRCLFASLLETEVKSRNVLQGVHLSSNKTEPFKIVQLGLLSDAVTYEIDYLEITRPIEMANSEPINSFDVSFDTQEARRNSRAERKRLELLKAELISIEEINIFDIKNIDE